jgi:hypothetical protein
MTKSLRFEIDHNYDFFQRNLAGFLVSHFGQYALLRSGEVIGFFAGPGEAYRIGLARFPDRLFSIQQVTDEPVEMGLLSVAVG